MGDVNRNTQATMASKITNEDETNIADVNVEKELLINDIPKKQGTSTVILLTTTPVELKVGVATYENRKYLTMQALDKNIVWGADTDCNFNIFKNQFFTLPYGTECKVYAKTTSGTASIAIEEK